jgi:hypothetical protein
MSTGDYDDRERPVSPIRPPPHFVSPLFLPWITPQYTHPFPGRSTNNGRSWLTLPIHHAHTTRRNTRDGCVSPFIQRCSSVGEHRRKPDSLSTRESLSTDRCHHMSCLLHPKGYVLHPTEGGVFCSHLTLMAEWEWGERSGRPCAHASTQTLRLCVVDAGATLNRVCTLGISEWRGRVGRAWAMNEQS